MWDNSVRFLDKSILLQDVSLEYNISHWNKTKQAICISKKYSCFTKDARNRFHIEDMISIVWTSNDTIFGVMAKEQKFSANHIREFGSSQSLRDTVV